MHADVRDVLITGGDPLLLPDQQIAYLIDSLRAMAHVEIVRIDSRVPIVLPQRITESLKKILGEYHSVPIWLSIQCNHPKELTDEVAWAVYDLLRCGVNIGHRLVPLKGLNDDGATFRALHRKLLRMRIRPDARLSGAAPPTPDQQCSSLTASTAEMRLSMTAAASV